MKTFLVVFGLIYSLNGWSAPEQRIGFDYGPLGSIAIQQRGRIKPLDTFATESLQFITGKREWQGKGAIECLVGWLFNFDREWEGEEFIRINYKPLKKEMGLDPDKNYFSYVGLQDNTGLKKILKEAGLKSRNRERLNDLEKKAVTVENQLVLVADIFTGQALTILPNPEGPSASWFPITSLNTQGGLPYASDVTERFANALKQVVEGFLNKDAAAWKSSSTELARIVSEDLAKGAYPENKVLQREIHYNHLRPFRLSWVFYVLGFSILLIYLVGRKKIFEKVGIVAVLLGLVVHTYGFTLRCLIAGRPPVTNMYESVIWVTWGCILFAMLVWMIYRNSVIPAAAAVFAIVGLILADNIPLVLDPSINPLEPVLRSNYWLTIHVLTITLSYAAFALSLCLGNVVMGYYVFRPTHTAQIQNYSLYMYRAMQIGVILLAVGTILGGVWADYSWGRFWGWDPKEVWALIALLLYLAVLHGRFTGWLKGFGFAATTVVSFLGVLMAWYGVNFVLGVGLHSYGFGSGGMGWVAGYILVQVVFIIVGYLNYKKAKATHDLDTSIFPKA
ncbi:MAG: cytochrome C biogenesis protein [Proteobacteria bacterium]|nr:cytochrome C biogenesis protein [Pseudomonadota bacterium]